MGDSWLDFMIPMLRSMIGDETVPYDYSDVDLQRKILTAINILQIELSFDVDYEADIVSLTLTPDPYTSSPIDYTFMTLATLKAACMIERSQVTKVTSGDVQEISDNDFKIKTGDTGKNKLEALKTNWCAAFEAAKRDYEIETKTDNLGRAVISPFNYTGYSETPRYGRDKGTRWH
jgi:hypothetical protein